jgi:hypothetical protein
VLIKIPVKEVFMRVLNNLSVKTVDVASGHRITFAQIGKDIVVVDGRLVSGNFLKFPIQNATMLFTRIAFGQFQFVIKRSTSGSIFAFEIEKGLTLSFDCWGFRTIHRIPGDKVDLLFIDVNDNHSITIVDQFDKTHGIHINNGVVEIS